MRITIDIDETDLAKIQKVTGIKKQSPAVRQALKDFLELTRRRRFLKGVLEGKTDYSQTNETLEASSLYDPD